MNNFNCNFCKSDKYGGHEHDCLILTGKNKDTPTVDSSGEADGKEEKWIQPIYNELVSYRNEEAWVNEPMKKVIDTVRTNRQSLITRIKGEIQKMKKETCDCLNTIGYHTKECDFEPFGYNQALTD